MAFAAEKRRHAEIHTDRLCVADVYVAVRLRRESGHNLAAGAPGRHVGIDPLP